MSGVLRVELGVKSVSVENVVKSVNCGQHKIS